MPRRTTTNDETSERERPARPRRPRTATATTQRSSTRRSTTTRRTASTRSAPAAAAEVAAPSRRKAPTTGTHSVQQNQPLWWRYKMQIGAAVLFFAGIGVSALVGFTDTGTIDVQAAVRAQEERARAAAAAAAREAGVEVAEADDTPAAPPVVQTSTLRPRRVGSPSAPPPGATAGVATATTSVMAGITTEADEAEPLAIDEEEVDGSDSTVIDDTDVSSSDETTTSPDTPDTDTRAE